MIPSSDLVVGGLYRVRARNFNLAVYAGNGQFIGVREKFGHYRLDSEWLMLDYPETFRGSVRPQTLLESCPVYPISEEVEHGFEGSVGNWYRNEPLFDYLEAAARRYPE